MSLAQWLLQWLVGSSAPSRSPLNTSLLRTSGQEKQKIEISYIVGQLREELEKMSIVPEDPCQPIACFCAFGFLKSTASV